jgi:acyl-CoA reductase-like NAD-dependent aldehyde dehydrogenase
LKEAVGVVGAIIPWNGPAIAALGKIAPVLATGCTMVLKPAEEAALTPLRIGELIQEVGLPSRGGQYRDRVRRDRRGNSQLAPPRRPDRIHRIVVHRAVASVLPFDDIDEVTRRANATQFGLGGGVWTRDVGKAHQVAHSINTGIVWVNTYGNFDPAMPFGGSKMSGWENEMSMHSLEEYLNVKAVWINTDI